MFKGGKQLRVMTASQRNFRLQKCLSSPMFLLPLRAFGGAVEKADPNQKHIAPLDKRFLMLNGMKGTSKYTFVLENPYRHHNDLGLFQ